MTQEQRKVARVLVVAAHPDDIEFGAAGTIARWTGAGMTVVYCMVTDGAAGSNEPGVNYAELVERRRSEQMCAAACLGVEDVRFLGYSDGTLEPTLDLRRDLTRVVRDVRPDRVVIADPTTVLVQEGEFDYINHPDHRAAAEAALYAVFPSAESRPIFSELLDEGFEPHHVNEVWMMLTTEPNEVVDVSAVYERKIEALMCHESQLKYEDTKFIRVLDAELGKRIGVAYAEEFRVMKFYRDGVSAGEAAL